MIRRLLLGCLPLLMAGGAVLAVAAPASATPLVPVTGLVPRPAARTTQNAQSGCAGIYNEMRRQGASASTANWFAYKIALRESGCTAQFVHDSDDWSYSRFGLNGKTAALRAGWKRLCGVDVRSATKNLSTDVRCALAAYRAMGTNPWRATR